METLAADEPYAVQLRAGLVVLDVDDQDAVTPTVALLDVAGVDYLRVASGGVGREHIWLRLDHELAPALRAALSDHALLPALDVRTGANRPPLALHRSRTARAWPVGMSPTAAVGWLEPDDDEVEAELAAETADRLGAVLDRDLASDARLLRELDLTSGASLGPTDRRRGRRRPLLSRYARLLEGPVQRTEPACNGTTIDASSDWFTVQRHAICRGWTLDELLAEADGTPLLRRLMDGGPTRGPRRPSWFVADWRRAHASLSSWVPPRPEVPGLAGLVTAVRSTVRPVDYGVRAQWWPAAQAVLLDLLDLVRAHGRLEVGYAVRQRGTGRTKSSSHRALRRLAAEGVIASSGAGGHQTTEATVWTVDLDAAAALVGHRLDDGGTPGGHTPRVEAWAHHDAWTGRLSPTVHGLGTPCLTLLRALATDPAAGAHDPAALAQLCSHRLVVRCPGGHRPVADRLLPGRLDAAAATLGVVGRADALDRRHAAERAARREDIIRRDRARRQRLRRPHHPWRPHPTGGHPSQFDPSILPGRAPGTSATAAVVTLRLFVLAPRGP